LPLLGIDLLSFGSSKILCVVDFQPLSQEAEYLERHTGMLAPVYERIREKCGHMSAKFFDETQFFSKYLVFYRSSLGAQEPTLQVPTGRLWEVYLEYVDIYLKALNGAQANEDADAMAYVQSRQDAYDQYNADRDPAIKLFNTYFGTEVGNRP
jgi:15,16-dihydrobiliverdin:ferredoxin oxidoreductase